MNEQRVIWILDPTVLKQIRIPEFGWIELGLFLCTVLFFVAYLFVVHVLDRRFAGFTRRRRKEEDLWRRLEPAGLDAPQWEALRALAGTRREGKLLEFLADPVRFESRVQRAHEAGEARELGFVPKLRGHLGYQSDNYLVPLISTRQLLPGDSVRLSPRHPDRLSHHYGTVDAVDGSTFTIRLGGAGLDPADLRAADMDLFVMRGQDLEHRFPFLPAGPPGHPARITLRHALARLDRTPRQIRLPLLIEVRYEERTPHGRAADPLDPEMAPGEPGRGVLYDLSDGGFALVTARAHAPGKLLRLTIPLRRPGKTLPLQGRVANCRPLPHGRFMVHATLRGLDRQQRHFLHQVVIHEQNRRQKTLARIKPRRAKAG